LPSKPIISRFGAFSIDSPAGVYRKLSHKTAWPDQVSEFARLRGKRAQNLPLSAKLRIPGHSHKKMIKNYRNVRLRPGQSSGNIMRNFLYYWTMKKEVKHKKYDSTAGDKFMIRTVSKQLINVINLS